MFRFALLLVLIATNLVAEVTSNLPTYFIRSADGRYCALNAAHQFCAGSTGIRIGRTTAIGFDRARAAEPIPSGEQIQVTAIRGGGKSSLSAFSQVQFHSVYPGIDLVYHGRGGQIEFDFVLRPGARVDRVRLRFPTSKASISAIGELVPGGGQDSFTIRKPRVLQDGRELPSWYALDHRGRARIAVTGRDSSRETTIDPVVAWAAVPGFGLTVQKASVDADGNTFVMMSSPSGMDPNAARIGTSAHILIYKIDAAATKILWATLMGGSTADIATAMAVDAAGAVYLAGTTASTDFPTTAGSFQPTFPAVPRFQSGAYTYTGFVVKLSPDGNSLSYSTYLGGSDEMNVTALAVDSWGNVLVTGSADGPGFPVTQGAYMALPERASRLAKPVATGFATKLNSTGTAPVYSALLPYRPYAAALDADGNAYLAGPEVLKLDPSGATALFRTKLPFGTCIGNVDDLSSIALDSHRNVFIAGGTCRNLQTTDGAFQPAHSGTPSISDPNGDLDGYLVKVAGDGSGTLFVSYLGGSRYDRIAAIAIAPDDSVWAVGSTASPDLAVSTDALQSKYAGGDNRFIPWGDGFVARISGAGDRLLYCSYLGGSNTDSLVSVGLDLAGNPYLGGSAGSRLATPGTVMRVPGVLSGGDVIVKYANDSQPAPILDAVSPASAEAGASDVTITFSGSGFANDAVVLWNRAARPTVVTSPKQLMATLSAADLAITGTAELRVLNPNSGSSNALTFAVVPPDGANPNPRITSLAPSSAIAGGKGFPLSIRGTGFTNAVTALWNDSMRPIRFIGPDEVQVDVTADDLAQTGQIEIRVEAPPPGGGRSNPVAFPVVGFLPTPGPTLLSVLPSQVSAGNADTTFKVSAYALTPATVVRWNGVDHPLLNHGALDGPVIQVTAGELRSPGAAQVTVYDPVTKRESNPLQVWIPVDLPSSDLAYSSFTRRLYAAAKDTTKGIVVIDPAGGEILGAYPMDIAAVRLAVSSDGRYLFTLVQSSVLRRYNLLDSAPWLGGMIQLPVQDVKDFAPVTGHPASVAVVSFPGTLTIFDDAAARPRIAQVGVSSGSLKFSDDGSTIYIVSESSGLGVLSGPIGDAGVGPLVGRGDPFGATVPVTLFRGKIYSANGRVYDAGTLQLLGTVPSKSYAAPLVTATSAVWLSGNNYYCSLVAYDANGFAPLWEMHTQPGCDVYANSGIFQVDDRVVFRMGDRIFLLSPPPAAPDYSVMADQPVTKAVLELRTNYSDLTTTVAVSPQEHLPVTALVGDGAFGFPDPQSETFRVAATPFGFPIWPRTFSEPKPGTYSGTLYLLLSGTSNSPARVPYEFQVVDTYPLGASVSSLAFSYKIGDSPPAAQSFSLTKDGAPVTLIFQFTPFVSWAQLTTSDGAAPGSITIRAVPAGLAPGTYTTSFQVRYPGQIGAEITIPITLTVGN